MTTCDCLHRASISVEAFPAPQLILTFCTRCGKPFDHASEEIASTLSHDKNCPVCHRKHSEEWGCMVAYIPGKTAT